MRLDGIGVVETVEQKPTTDGISFEGTSVQSDCEVMVPISGGVDGYVKLKQPKETCPRVP